MPTCCVFTHTRAFFSRLFTAIKRTNNRVGTQTPLHRGVGLPHPLWGICQRPSGGIFHPCLKRCPPVCRQRGGSGVRGWLLNVFSGANPEPWRDRERERSRIRQGSRPATTRTDTQCTSLTSPKTKVPHIGRACRPLG